MKSQRLQDGKGLPPAPVKLPWPQGRDRREGRRAARADTPSLEGVKGADSRAAYLQGVYTRAESPQATRSRGTHLCVCVCVCVCVRARARAPRPRVPRRPAPPFPLRLGTKSGGERGGPPGRTSCSPSPAARRGRCGQPCARACPGGGGARLTWPGGECPQRHAKPRGGAELGAVVRQADAQPGGPKRVPGVPAHRVQRGEHALLAGLRGAQGRGQPARGG